MWTELYFRLLNSTEDILKNIGNQTTTKDLLLCCTNCHLCLKCLDELSLCVCVITYIQPLKGFLLVDSVQSLWVRDLYVSGVHVEPETETERRVTSADIDWQLSVSVFDVFTVLEADGVFSSIFLSHEKRPVGARRQESFSASPVHVTSEPETHTHTRWQETVRPVLLMTRSECRWAVCVYQGRADKSGGDACRDTTTHLLH